MRLRRGKNDAAALTNHEDELRRYVESLDTVADRMAQEPSTDGVIQAALDAVRRAFTCHYASCWWIDPGSQLLTLRQESGQVGPEFRTVTREATFAQGVGLAGRAWRDKKLVFAPDLAEVTDCVRAPVANSSGILSAVAFPLVVDGAVVGTMDFFADPDHTPGPIRLTVLQTVGRLVGQALERVAAAQRREDAQQDMAAINTVLRVIADTTCEDEAIKAALDTVRTEFGWEYGSFWIIDDQQNVLVNRIESGSAGREFEEVTRQATFAEGVGLAGRTWAQQDLVFEPDMAKVTDCVRAPAAQRAGVKAGVCLPIIVDHQIIGTMDFFATTPIVLTQDRETALKNTAFLVSNAIERHRAAHRIDVAGQELLSSITEVERNVLDATNVASEAAHLTSNATQIVARLNDSSVEIGNVVKVITSIAEQTNLLALNATIEAARAGEAGKGFAVVANEVKDLARETAKATEEVDAKVTAIQTDASSVVDALHHVTQTVGQINEAQNIISGVLTQQNAVTRSVLQS